MPEPIVLTVTTVDEEIGTHRISFKDIRGKPCAIHESMIDSNIYITVDGASMLLSPETVAVLLPYFRNFAMTKKLLGN